MTSPRITPKLSLQEYANAIAQGWPEDDLGRAIIHDLPRRFHALTEEEQRQVMENAPALTGTRWDALLAACGAHLRAARTPGTELDGRAGAIPERDLGAGVDAEHLVQRIGIRATRIRPARGRARPA